MRSLICSITCLLCARVCPTCPPHGSTSAEAYQHAELILFTEEAAALAAIEAFDSRYQRQASPSSPEPGRGPAATTQLDLVTAGTSPAAAPLSARGQLARAPTLPVAAQQPGSSGRPLTGALGHPVAAAAVPAAGAVRQEHAGSSAASSRGSTCGSMRGGSHTDVRSGGGALHCKELTLILLDTWGDRQARNACCTSPACRPSLMFPVAL